MSIAPTAAHPDSLGQESRSAGTLDSWKAIAGYLNRTVRTVQRWHKYEGLPIRSHFHKKAKTVYAFVEEVDAWRAGRDLRRSEPLPPSNDQRAYWRNNSLIFTFRPSRIVPMVTLSNILKPSVGAAPIPNSDLSRTAPCNVQLKAIGPRT